MSQENVEVVRRVADALRAGDYVRAASEFHPDAKWHNTDAFPGPKTCSGPTEIRRFWETLYDAFEIEGMEIEKAVESGEMVVVLIHSWGAGQTSAAPMDVRWASVYRFDRGKVIRVDVHGHYGKALEAAGLSE